MRDFRAHMPPSGKSVRRPSGLSFRLRRTKRRLLRIIGRGDERITIPRNQTAELWMVPLQRDRRPQPMAYTCPECSKKEETRLLSVVLETTPTRRPWKSKSFAKRTEHPRILLKITRSQLDDINADFERRPPPTRRRPDNRSDREMVLGSLVS